MSPKEMKVAEWMHNACARRERSHGDGYSLRELIMLIQLKGRVDGAYLFDGRTDYRPADLTDYVDFEEGGRALAVPFQPEEPFYGLDPDEIDPTCDYWFITADARLSTIHGWATGGDILNERPLKTLDE